MEILAVAYLNSWILKEHAPNPFLMQYKMKSDN